MLPSRSAEGGFVLIGAVWLLLLCTALVAVMMIRGKSRAKTASNELEILQLKLDRDAAIETVAADLLIAGPASAWWRQPAGGTVTIGRDAVKVAVSDERGRLDLNEADPIVLDGALRGLGYPARQRVAFLDALRTRRAKGRIASSADVDARVAGLAENGPNTLCLPDLFTIDGGAAQPAVDQMGRDLAHALEFAAVGQAAPIHPGDSIRVAASAPGGATSFAVVRPIATPEMEVPMSRRWFGKSC